MASPPGPAVEAPTLTSRSSQHIQLSNTAFSQAPDDSKVFPIQRLPAELRTMIYEQLFGDGSEPLIYRVRSYKDVPYAVRPRANDNGDDDEVFTDSRATSILRVNKEISEEALPVLYLQSAFIFDGGYSFHVFMATSQPGQKYLRRIVIQADWLQAKRVWIREGMKVLKPSSRLREIEIEIRFGLWTQKIPHSLEAAVTDLCFALNPFLLQASTPELRRRNFELITFTTFNSHYPTSDAVLRQTESKVKTKIEEVLKISGL